MINSQPNVFVGKYNASAAKSGDLFIIGSGVEVGDVFFTDVKGAVLSSATAAQPFYVNQVIGQESFNNNGTMVNLAILRTSNIVDPVRVINGELIANYTTDAGAQDAPEGIGYSPAVEEVMEIDFGSLAVSAEERYVIRIQSKDLEQFGAQPAVWSKSYEVFGSALPAATSENLANEFVRQINNDRASRVIASATGSVVTLTGLPKTDNEGVNSLNQYSQVSFIASVYKTKLFDVVFYNNYYEAMPGVNVEITTKPYPGKGTWKLVRDAEYSNLATRGIYSMTEFPVYLPKMFVKESETYSTIDIEFDNNYDPADLQLKNNPISVKIFAEGNETAHLALVKTLVLG